MITQEEEQLIQEVLNEFNFSRVRKMMAAVDMKWFNIGDVPSCEDLQRTAKKLLQEVLEHRKLVRHQAAFPIWTETGGLRAVCWQSGKLELFFLPVKAHASPTQGCLPF